MLSLCLGAWYFYPFGLHTLQPTLASWWAAKESRRQPELWESRDASPHFQVSPWGGGGADFCSLTAHTELQHPFPGWLCEVEVMGELTVP